MSDLVVRIAENLADRITGPLHMRLVVQPVMASLFAVIDGLQDATARKPPYLWSMVGNPARRRALLKHGWHSVGKIFAIAVALDVAYQLAVQGFVYVGETIIVAFLLAIVPYVLLRGPVTRIATRPR